MTFSVHGAGSGGYAIGPVQNTFEGVDLADAQAARDTYFAANPAKLAAYDSNPFYLIRLAYPGTTTAEYRQGGQWIDYTPFLQGPPGDVASLVDVPVGELPYKRLDGTFGGSRMRVLDDGSLLAPPGFGVESGSVTFGDVLVLSEAAGFLNISNLVNERTYTLLDYYTPRTAASAVPSAFMAANPSFSFVAQSIDTSNLSTNPLVFDYTIQNTSRTYSLFMRAYAPMNNVRIKITQVSNNVTLKYVPSKEAWETGVGGLTWAIGDNTFDFEDTPLILRTGQAVRFEIEADVIALKGDSNGITYFGGLDQLGTFQDVVMDRDNQPANIRDKLTTLTGTNRLPMSAIKDGVTSVAGRIGDVVLTAADVSGLAPVATSGAYNDLTGKPTIPTLTSQLTNDSGYITAAAIPVTSVAGKAGAVTLVKGDVGLGNVDNTSDLTKPVSVDQQAAIDLKMTQHNAAVDPHPQYTTTAEAAAAAPVQSVNGSTGTVTLNTGNVAESGNLYYTDARVGSYLTATGYTVRSSGSVGTGAAVYQTTSGGLATFRAINGTGLITVTQNTNDITVSAPLILNGLYTPTITNIANIQSSTAFQCMYTRVGTMVTVSGRVTIDPSTNGSATSIELSLPIASNLGVPHDLAGTSGCADTQQAGAVFGNTATDRAVLGFSAGSNAAREHYFTFSYRVI